MIFVVNDFLNKVNIQKASNLICCGVELGKMPLYGPRRYCVGA